MQKRVSLKDIATKVGVSTALVSYVLNGLEKEKRVGAEVVKKIRLAAEELNYQPNQIARSLRMKTTKTIGLIVADIANPFFGQLARIIENEANTFGYTVIIGCSDEDELKSEALITTLLNRQVDGFIIVPAAGTNAQIQSLLKRHIPVVLVDRFFEDVNTSHVIIDNFKATSEATSYFISKGLKKIAMVAYKSPLSHMKDRIKGYADTMKVNNLADNICIVEVRYEHFQEDLDIAFKELVVEKKKVNALLFATNALSVAGLYFVQKQKLKIPDDVAFIGFDGGDSFELFNPPLSFVQQPIENIGKEAINVLMRILNGSDEVSQITLSSSLINRNSENRMNDLERLKF